MNSYLAIITADCNELVPQIDDRIAPHPAPGDYAVRPTNVVTVGGQYIGEDPNPHVLAAWLRRSPRN